MWDRNGDCVMLSRRLSSRIKTLGGKKHFEFHAEPPYANYYIVLEGKSICTFSQSSWCTYLDTTCRTVNRTMRGPTATRNQGKTPEITPTQKNTRMTFWMNISAWNGKRTSTGEDGRKRGRSWVQKAKTTYIKQLSPAVHHWQWPLLAYSNLKCTFSLGCFYLLSCWQSNYSHLQK